MNEQIMQLKAQNPLDERQEVGEVIEQEGEEAADDSADDRAVQVEPPILRGIRFRLKPVPFFLGLFVGAALYFLLTRFFIVG